MWPNNCDSASDSTRLEQLSVTNGPFGAGPNVWSARATSSLPVPDSPEISTVALYGLSCDTDFRTLRTCAERTTMPPSRSALCTSWVSGTISLALAPSPLVAGGGLASN